MRNACDSDSRCGLACDASARDAKSLAMWVERCEPLSLGVRGSLFWMRCPCPGVSSRSPKRGVEFKGGSLHDDFGGFGGSGEHLALLLLVLKNTAQ